MSIVDSEILDVANRRPEQPEIRQKGSLRNALMSCDDEPIFDRQTRDARLEISSGTHYYGGETDRQRLS
jgi:hypothetical protein